MKRMLGQSEERYDDSTPVRFSRTSLPKEFTPKAYNFEEVDFISDHELVIREDESAPVGIYGQFDFVDLLYINTEWGRIEFGVRRAILIIEDRNGQKPNRSDHIKASSKNVRYLSLHRFPEALTISIDPPSGKTALGELVLPPGPGMSENRLSQLGTLPTVEEVELMAVLTVNLNTEGIFLKGHSELGYSNAELSKIEAILSVAAEKYAGAERGAIRRQIEVKDERAEKE